jgi:hypothetical protein
MRCGILQVFLFLKNRLCGTRKLREHKHFFLGDSGVPPLPPVPALSACPCSPFFPAVRTVKLLNRRGRIPAVSNV